MAILLTKKGETVLVSEQDVRRLKLFSWYITKEGYVRTNVHRMMIPKLKSKSILIHRLVCRCPKGMNIDHVNGNKLDNRRDNLRICTPRENARHVTKMDKRNKSGFRGVCWRKDRSIWTAYICLNGKNVYLGSSKDVKIANGFYKQAVNKYFGEFAPTI